MTVYTKIYVLELVSHKWYVGSTYRTMEARLREHEEGYDPGPEGEQFKRVTGMTKNVSDGRSIRDHRPEIKQVSPYITFSGGLRL